MYYLYYDYLFSVFNLVIDFKCTKYNYYCYYLPLDDFSNMLKMKLADSAHLYTFD